jgi:hypothetical protein
MIEETRRQNEQDKAARLAPKKEAARVEAEADGALLAVVKEHSVALEERNAHAAELQ